MANPFSLQPLYLTMMKGITQLSSIDVCVGALFQQTSVNIEEVIEDCTWCETLMSTEKGIDNWKRLLTIALLNHLSGQPVRNLAIKTRQFENQPWNENSQYFRLLVALNHVLSGLPVPEVGAHLLEYGAALIDLQEYCPWMSIPYSPYHLEFGIFLCLLAYLTKKEELNVSIIRLAKWQLNCLDSNYKPFSTLFVREQEGDVWQNLVLYYLFFHSVSSLNQENEFESAAQALAKLIKEEWERNPKPIQPLWVLVEKLFGERKKTSFLPFPLPEHIYDPSTSLVGYRSKQSHAICTLHGGHTGLGCIRMDDVEILNYGPQYLPLEDCFGFGVEGNHLSDHGMRKSIIELHRKGFVLKGCARMVDQPSSSPLQLGQFRGIWLEIIQEFKQEKFNLRASFLGLDGWEGTAFSFFVKAERCKGDFATLSANTLNRYEGEAQPLFLEGFRSTLQLTSPSFKGMMQVIPLGGNNHFWGANFLIAYLIPPDQRHFQWQLEEAVRK